MMKRRGIPPGEGGGQEQHGFRKPVEQEAVPPRTETETVEMPTVVEVDEAELTPEKLGVPESTKETKERKKLPDHWFARAGVVSPAGGAPSTLLSKDAGYRPILIEGLRGYDRVESEKRGHLDIRAIQSYSLGDKIGKIASSADGSILFVVNQGQNVLIGKCAPGKFDSLHGGGGSTHPAILEGLYLDRKQFIQLFKDLLERGKITAGLDSLELALTFYQLPKEGEATIVDTETLPTNFAGTGFEENLKQWLSEAEKTINEPKGVVEYKNLEKFEPDTATVDEINRLFDVLSMPKKNTPELSFFQRMKCAMRLSVLEKKQKDVSDELPDALKEFFKKIDETNEFRSVLGTHFDREIDKLLENVAVRLKKFLESVRSFSAQDVTDKGRFEKKLWTLDYNASYMKEVFPGALNRLEDIKKIGELKNKALNEYGSRPV